MTTTKNTDIIANIRNFMKLESFSGVLLLVVSIAAMILANSPLSYLYESLLETKLIIQIGEFAIHKPLLLWINDGLMAIFFFLIGLEVKREFLEGELSSFSQVALPAAGALGGMVVPAVIYAALNWTDKMALDGWAIPVATDIAFALALLTAFGKRVPTSLKIFLLTLAIFDDLAAIVIIAIFYSADLTLVSLVCASVILSIAIAINKLKVTRTSAYIILGIALWIAVLKSGVHATLAGVLIAFCVPMRDENGNSPLKTLEHNIHGTVAFAVLPIFAFANAGLSFESFAVSDLLHPITTGIVLGLVVGKPLGIMLFVFLATVIGIAKLPKDLSWSKILGVSFACGIGFTMSLFIASLAFEHNNHGHFYGDRVGIVLGSVISALIAYVILKATLPQKISSK